MSMLRLYSRYDSLSLLNRLRFERLGSCRLCAVACFAVIAVTQNDLEGCAEELKPHRPALQAWQEAEKLFDNFQLVHKFEYTHGNESRTTITKVSKRGDLELARSRGPISSQSKAKDREAANPIDESVAIRNRHGTFVINRTDESPQWQIAVSGDSQDDNPELDIPLEDVFQHLSAWECRLTDLNDRPDYLVTKWAPSPDRPSIYQLHVEHAPDRSPQSSGAKKQFELIELDFDSNHNYRLVSGRIIQNAAGETVTGYISVKYDDELNDRIPVQNSILWRSPDPEIANPVLTTRLTGFVPEALPAEQFELEYYGLTTPYKGNSWSVDVGTVIVIAGFCVVGLGAYLSYRRAATN